MEKYLFEQANNLFKYNSHSIIQLFKDSANIFSDEMPDENDTRLNGNEQESPRAACDASEDQEQNFNDILSEFMEEPTHIPVGDTSMQANRYLSPMLSPDLNTSSGSRIQAVQESFLLENGSVTSNSPPSDSNLNGIVGQQATDTLTQYSSSLVSSPLYTSSPTSDQSISTPEPLTELSNRDNETDDMIENIPPETLFNLDDSDMAAIERLVSDIHPECVGGGTQWSREGSAINQYPNGPQEQADEGGLQLSKRNPRYQKDAVPILPLHTSCKF